MAQVLVLHGNGDAGLPGWVEALERSNHDVHVARDVASIFRLGSRVVFDVAFLDVALIGQENLDLIRFLKGNNPEMELITVTSVENLREAAGTILKGAALYLVEPVDKDLALQLVMNAGNRQQNALVVRQFQQRTLEQLFGESQAMARLFRTVLKVAPTDATILVTGESGTGKELLAQVIHRLSRRVDRKFVAVNCAAIPEALLESELFGHVKGAFTGATVDKKGLLEEADTGTCFLDEVGELPLTLQVKLLRFLQDRNIRRVGSVQSRRIDVRILAATNRDLAHEVREGRFREDLFYRLNVINLHLLPLRARKETLPTLINHILTRLRVQHGKDVGSLSAEVLQIFRAYSFPGNIRELENILEYAVIMCDTHQITRNDLPPHLSDPGVPLLEQAVASAHGGGAPGQESPIPTDRLLTLDQMEQLYVEEVLRRCGNNQSEAARVLGISRTSLWRKLKKGTGESGNEDGSGEDEAEGPAE